MSYCQNKEVKYFQAQQKGHVNYGLERIGADTLLQVPGHKKKLSKKKKDAYNRKYLIKCGQEDAQTQLEEPPQLEELPDVDGSFLRTSSPVVRYFKNNMTHK